MSKHTPDFTDLAYIAESTMEEIARTNELPDIMGKTRNKERSAPQESSKITDLFAADLIALTLNLADGDGSLLVGDKKEGSITVYNNAEAAKAAHKKGNDSKSKKKKKHIGRFVLFDKTL